MTQLKFERKHESWEYVVLHLNGTVLGHLVMDESGYYYYWPTVARYGVYSEETLREIADELHELNKEYIKQLEELHESED